MAISGTRSAIAIPFGALGTYIILSHSLKARIVGVSTFVFLFLFFTFTSIGDSNQYIHKMRSAFRPNQDASYLVRVYNREK